VATSIAASRVRALACPERSCTLVKEPPMNRVPPLIAMALTRPFGWAHGCVAVALTAATEADAPTATKAAVQSAANGRRVCMVFPQVLRHWIGDGPRTRPKQCSALSPNYRLNHGMALYGRS
jgi:hypothetical protein